MSDKRLEARLASELFSPLLAVIAFLPWSMTDVPQPQPSDGDTQREPSLVRLRAVAGRPLADEAVRGRVLAIAREHAASEHVKVLRSQADDRMLEMVVSLPRGAAFAFIARVRQLSNEWYQQTYDVGPLWPVAVHHDDESQEDV